MKIEHLEDRLLLAILAVNSNDDVSDGLCDAVHCSLREAIEAANAMPGADIVHFQIPGAGVPTIAPTSELPTVTDPLTIDGTTQSAGRVELDGSNAGTGSDGLVIISGNSTVRGLVINRYSGRGIVLAQNGGNQIEGNLIGTDAGGAVDLGNGSAGVLILDTSRNTIGGTRPEARNVISGNDSGGIDIGGVGAMGNVVQGNYIGTDVSGAAALGNKNYGVLIFEGSSFNLIGGAEPAARNVISANEFSGIGMVGNGTDRNIVAGNFIGTDAVGTTALGNANRGVDIGGGAKLNVVGSNGDNITDAAERNVISGNGWEGIGINGAATDLNVVAGNLIGTDTSGMFALGNALSGVVLFGGAQSNRIGTNGDGVSDAEERNLISGNGHSGITILTPATDRNVVAGNFIGTEVTGTDALSNGIDGVLIFGGASNNSVGGTSTAARNIISGNQNGVRISGTDANGNMVQGNFIGTDVSGSVRIGNSITGVGIDNIVTGNVVGGSVAGAGNVISGNGGGVRIVAQGANGNLVQGNRIGTDFSGTAAIGNRDYGILIDVFAANNTVGGAVASARNIIAGNDGPGVWIDNATSNAVFGNFIGTDVTGTLDLGNSTWGVLIQNRASANTIGGAVATARNIISGNGAPGIEIKHAGSSGNLVLGNLIGTDVSGTADLGNDGPGVIIFEGATGNTIGGTTASARNIISGNGSHGVQISLTNPAVAAGNAIPGNAEVSVPVLSATTNGLVSWWRAEGNAHDAADDNDGRLRNGAGFAPGMVGQSFSFDGVNDSVSVPFSENFDFRPNGQFTIATWVNPRPSGAFQAILVKSPPSTLWDWGLYLDVSNRFMAGLAFQHVVLSNTVAQEGIWYHVAATYNNGDWSMFINGNLEATAMDTPITRSASGLALGRKGKSASFTDFFHGLIDEATIFSRALDLNDIRSLFGVGAAGRVGNVVQGNFIGTDVTGTVPLGNSNSGIGISDSSGNVIGGTAAGAGNLISGNAVHGIQISQFGRGAARNLVQGNLIGTDIIGTTKIGNGFIGVLLIAGATDNTIGGAMAGARNVISGNGTNGVEINGSGTSGNLVQGNLIGTDVSGMADLGNGLIGMLILNGPTNNTVGGTADRARNVISGNGSNGVEITGAGASGNLVHGNFIGTDMTGTADLGNDIFGILLSAGASNNTVGGTADGARNLISGSGSNGVEITGTGSTGNSVRGNLIGTDVTGMANLGNALFGVLISGGAANNTIGGQAERAGNSVAFSGRAGVAVFGGSTGTAVLANSVFANGGLGIDLGADGVTPNDPGDSDAGANNLQNFPHLLTAIRKRGVIIKGRLNSTPLTRFRLEFFANDALDPSGHGEGQRFLGSTIVTTNDVGDAAFRRRLRIQVPVGHFITATATDPANNTSEFSAGVRVTGKRAVVDDGERLKAVAEQTEERGRRVVDATSHLARAETADETAQVESILSATGSG